MRCPVWIMAPSRSRGYAHRVRRNRPPAPPRTGLSDDADTSLTAAAALFVMGEKYNDGVGKHATFWKGTKNVTRSHARP